MGGHLRALGAAALAFALTCLSGCTPSGFALATRHAASGSARNGTNHAALRDLAWMDRSLSPERRADLLVERMSTAEKLALVHGVVEGILQLPPVDYAGYVSGSARLGIPPLTFEDGPGGIGDGMQGVTDFPVPLALAATWDAPLGRAFGSAIGEEARAKGVDVLLGPTVNVVRDPRWGRAFETFGEDPLVSSQMGVQVVEGVQSHGVIAEVKHLGAYSQESGRMDGDAKVSEKALEEVYLPPFEAAVKVAHAGAVMAAYDKVNGTYASQDGWLLTSKLVDEWGFRGFTTSDWDGTHSTVEAANAGLDVELPDARYFGDSLARAVTERRVSMARVDAMARSVLTSMFAAGLMDRHRNGDPLAPVTTSAHRDLARRIEEEAIVLLKDSGRLLPLVPQHLGSIALFDFPVGLGAPAAPQEKVGGCGSAYVNPNGTVGAFQAIARRAGPGVRVVAGDPYDPQLAVSVAARSTVAVVVVHDDGCEDVSWKSLEGSNVADRPDLSLPAGEDALIDAVASANPRTIVVLETQGAVVMPWLPKVAAVLEAWYGGEELGDALAAVLFGDVDPSGRLPVTFPASLAQMPTSSPASFPGVDGTSDFSEGIDVGYRYWVSHGIEPLFPFGFGLSYTDFRLSQLSVRSSVRSGQYRDGASPTTLGSLSASVAVDNVGRRSGAYVVELYVGDPRSTGEPPRLLAAFRRVTLGPGRSTVVSMSVPASALASYDSIRKRWVVVPGRYAVMVGSSAQDIQRWSPVVVP